jgi:hypothetical protein
VVNYESVDTHASNIHLYRNKSWRRSIFRATVKIIRH